MKKVVLVMFLVIFMSVIASACFVIPPIKQNTCGELVQTCANCSFVNVTNVHLPDSSILQVNVEMFQSVNTFNYSFCNTSINGKYVYDTIGDPDGFLVSESVCFLVTPTGEILGVPEAIFYLVFIVFFFLLFIFMINKMFISELAGYKISYFLLAYALFLVIIFAIYRLVSDFLWSLPYLGSILFYFFFIILILYVPIIIGSIGYLIINYMNEVQKRELFKRGHSEESVNNRLRRK